MATKKSSSKKKSSSGSGSKSKRTARNKVGKVMHEYKHHELSSGRSGKKVKSRKQAIAIGLSEARRAGANVPPNPHKKAAKKKSASKRSSSKSTAKKSSTKKSSARKSTTKKHATKKSGR